MFSILWKCLQVFVDLIPILVCTVPSSISLRIRTLRTNLHANFLRKTTKAQLNTQILMKRTSGILHQLGKMERNLKKKKNPKRIRKNIKIFAMGSNPGPSDYKKISDPCIRGQLIWSIFVRSRKQFLKLYSKELCQIPCIFPVQYCSTQE